MAHRLKDPDSRIRVGFDWTAWLANVSDTIASSTWVVPAGITSSSPANTTTQASVFLSGGTVDATYIVTNRMTTAAGRIEDRSVVILVRNR